MRNAHIASWAADVPFAADALPNLAGPAHSARIKQLRLRENSVNLKTEL